MHGESKSAADAEAEGPAAPFSARVRRLPHLGIGVSTEYGAASAGLDPFELAAGHPAYGAFLEVGVEIGKGLDADARRWAAEERPTTYHFLDINLDEPEDFDPAWLASVRGLIDELRPAWLCGDAGLWHFGPRERGHMLLLPPVLTLGSARAMAAGIARLREETGLEVLPENPPGQVFLGDLHLVEYFAEVCERADTGLLLDLAHLAIYQMAQGYPVLSGLDALPTERIVEMHVAGGTPRLHEGLRWVDDTHGGDVLPEVWTLFEHLVPRCPNLRAVVFECERNPIDATLPGFRRIAEVLAGHHAWPRDRHG